jgi:ribosomal protein L11 methyltransferase
VTWFALRVEASRGRDAIVATLIDAGAHGVQEEPDFLLSHFRAPHQAEAAATAVRSVEPTARCGIAEVGDVDWSVAWRRGVRSVVVGDFTIAPPWLAAGLDPARAVIIDPGMGFGTGDHASTRGAARLLQGALRRGATVADLGTGSAVLAILAAKLGAARVIAVDSDPDAIKDAQANVERNGVSAVAHVIEGDVLLLLPLVGPVDLVVANIASGVLAPLLPSIALALRGGGSAILAGVLEGERDGMVHAAHDAGFRILREDREEGWWGGLIERR